MEEVIFFALGIVMRNGKGAGLESMGWYERWGGGDWVGLGMWVSWHRAKTPLVWTRRSISWVEAGLGWNGASTRNRI